MREQDLIARATKADYQRCLRNDLIFNQPDRGLSEIDGDYVVLRNDDGVLALYWITDKGLHFVEHSDSEVREYV